MGMHTQALLEAHTNIQTLYMLDCSDFRPLIEMKLCFGWETHGYFLIELFNPEYSTCEIQSNSVTSISAEQAANSVELLAAAFAMSLRFHDLLSCAVGYRKLERRWLAFELWSRQFSVENRSRLSRWEGSRFRDVQYAICYHNTVSPDSCYLS